MAKLTEVKVEPTYTLELTETEAESLLDALAAATVRGSSFDVYEALREGLGR